MSEKGPSLSSESDTIQRAIDLEGRAPIELGSATPVVRRIETAGDTFDSPYIRRVTELDNVPGVGEGDVRSVDVSANTVKRANDTGGTTMEFQANTAGVYNADTRTADYARVKRRTSDGQEYVHKFRSPETAKKFTDLIAKQAVRRAEASESQNKAA